MKLPVYLSLLDESEQALAEAYRQMSSAHGDEPDVHFLCLTHASQCDTHRAKLAPVIERYGSAAAGDEPERLHHDGVGKPRTGPLGMLRDLQDLYLLATLVDVTWVMVKQAAQALRDAELRQVVEECDHQTSVQLAWLVTRMKQSAPQTLVAAR